MKRVETRRAVRDSVAAARAAGRRIALVPTMGYLHEGHLSLIERARDAADFIVVSIYVNPLQFGPTEDLARYPRDLERDTQLLEPRRPDLIFAPGDSEMYPHREPGVYVVAPALANRLCGAFRPGHFQGVLTVVAKLFNIVLPDVAVFGRKDFQQLVLVRSMARDLDFAVEVVAGATVREPDGLALSSRNVYLDPEARAEAALLNRALRTAQDAFSAGERESATLIETACAVLETGSLVIPQYVELVDAETLDAVDRAEAGNVMALAAHVGGTRLIDNHTLTRDPSS